MRRSAVFVGAVEWPLVCGWKSGGPVSKPNLSGAWNWEVGLGLPQPTWRIHDSLPASSSIIYLPSLRCLRSLLLDPFRSSLSPLLVTTRPLLSYYSATTLLSFHSVGGNLLGNWSGMARRVGAGFKLFAAGLRNYLRAAPRPVSPSDGERVAAGRVRGLVARSENCFCELLSNKCLSEAKSHPFGLRRAWRVGWGIAGPVSLLDLPPRLTSP